MQSNSFKKSLHERYYSSSVLAKLWQVLIYSLVFVSITFLLMEYHLIGSTLTVHQLKNFDVLISSVFLFDYILRLYISPQRLIFIKNKYNVLDLISILPAFLIFLNGFEALRGARIFRALRALRVLRILRIAKKIEESTQERLKEKMVATDEIYHYKILLNFYENKRDNNKTEAIASIIKNYFNKLNKHMLKDAELNQIDDRNLLHISMYELMRQAYPIVKALQKESNQLELKKLRYIVREMGETLINETNLDSNELLEERKVSRVLFLYLLLKSSVNDVIIAATIALALNLFMRMAGLMETISPVLEYIGVVEGVLGSLILLITSFNIRFASKKRQCLEDRAVFLMNYLTYYATRLRTTIENFETNSEQKKLVIKELKYHFDCIGYSILNSTKSRDLHGVNFDTAIMQVLERIRFLIKPYKDQMDARTYDKYEEMHGNCISYTNQFQVESTTGIPLIYNELNKILINAVYFTLLLLSPIEALPRILLMNLLQISFYRVAQETDKSILKHSLAKIPLNKRMIRRLCRIGSILST